MLHLGLDVASYASEWYVLKWFLSFVNENQARKEAEKTAVTKVVVAAADKAKEQELKSQRTREVIATKQEQTHITHEQVGLR